MALSALDRPVRPQHRGAAGGRGGGPVPAARNSETLWPPPTRVRLFPLCVLYPGGVLRDGAEAEAERGGRQANSFNLKHRQQIDSLDRINRITPK